MKTRGLIVWESQHQAAPAKRPGGTPRWLGELGLGLMDERVYIVCVNVHVHISIYIQHIYTHICLYVYVNACMYVFIDVSM